jgi:DNA-binding NarL/FixJ family response regulator
LFKLPLEDGAMFPIQSADLTGDGEAWALRGSAKPRIYLVSDVRLFRDGLQASLESRSDVQLVGCSNAFDAPFQLEAARPDVTLIDLSTRLSLALPKRMRLALPNLRFVAFAVVDVDAEVLACAEAGVCAYVAQDGSIDDLVNAAFKAIDGEFACPPRIAALLFRRIADLSITSAGAPTEPLTPRELEVATQVADGLANKEVARRLRMAPATVKNHVHNILQKLSLQRRSQLSARSFCDARATGPRRDFDPHPPGPHGRSTSWPRSYLP